MKEKTNYLELYAELIDKIIIFWRIKGYNLTQARFNTLMSCIVKKMYPELANLLNWYITQDEEFIQENKHTLNYQYYILCQITVNFRNYNFFYHSLKLAYKKGSIPLPSVKRFTNCVSKPRKDVKRIKIINQ